MAARPDQRSAEGQARRDHRDQDADLAHHGDRLPPRQRRRADPARHHHALRLHATTARRSSAPTLFPAIAANPFITFHTVATESGTFEFQWTGDNGFSLRTPRRRSRSNEFRCARSSRSRLLLAASPALPRRPKSRSDQRRSGYADHEPRHQGDAGRRHRQSRHAVRCSTARRCGTSKAGAAGKSCADCHGDARDSMKGVAARYPAFDKALGRPVNLEQRINLCRTRAPAGAAASPTRASDLLALTAYVATPVARHADRAGDDPRLKPFIDAGPRAVHAAPGPAQPVLRAIATTTTGASTSPATPIRRRIRPAIRSTGWNGRRSARCSGGCATA